MAEVFGLTDRFVATARVAADVIQSDYFESNPKWRGLVMRVSRTGLKTWCYFFTWQGKRVRMTLGTYPALSVAAAHLRAVEARMLLEAVPKIDPRVVMRTKVVAQPTVSELAEAYLRMRARPVLRSAPKIQWTLNKHVLPVIGAVPLSELHKRDINRVIDPIIVEGKKVAAARTFQIMSAMFSWAVGRGDLDRNPLEKMSKPDDYNPRDRTLSDEEIKLFWAEIELVCDLRSIALILKLCLTTAQRIGEVAGMSLAELDLNSFTWRIPASRSKNKHAHEVPLTPVAISLIRAAIAESGGSAFLFPGQRGVRISMSAVSAAVSEARSRLSLPHWSSHDLRRTAANKMAELGVLDGVIGHVLNHRSVTRATVTQRHYTPRVPHREMREALQLWADRLLVITHRETDHVSP
jgi:integrase